MFSYLFVTRLGWETSLYLLAAYFLLSFVVKLLATIAIYIVKRVNSLEVCLCGSLKMAALRSNIVA